MRAGVGHPVSRIVARGFHPLVARSCAPGHRGYVHGHHVFIDPHADAAQQIRDPADSGLKRARSQPMLGRVANLSASEAPIRLAVYGSLAPGQPNHHHLADISGTWRDGWVEGVLYDCGWGAAQGFPGIRLERGGPRVEAIAPQRPISGIAAFRR